MVKANEERTTTFCTRRRHQTGNMCDDRDKKKFPSLRAKEENKCVLIGIENPQPGRSRPAEGSHHGVGLKNDRVTTHLTSQVHRPVVAQNAADQMDSAAVAVHGREAIGATIQPLAQLVTVVERLTVVDRDVVHPYPLALALSLVIALALIISALALALIILTLALAAKATAAAAAAVAVHVHRNRPRIRRVCQVGIGLGSGAYVKLE